jgi:hypothetical protein
METTETELSLFQTGVLQKFSNLRPKTLIFLWGLPSLGLGTLVLSSSDRRYLCPKPSQSFVCRGERSTN